MGQSLKLPKIQFHGKKKDLFDFTSFFAWTFLNLLAHCAGDSGGPTVWKDKSDSNRAYIVGVISHGARDKEMCKLPPNQQHSKATIHATVSKEVSEWISKIVEKDGDACLVHWKMETKESEIL